MTRKPGGAKAKSRNIFLLKQLHQWHWISSAIALVGLLLFAITGITLNNAAQIETVPQVTQRQLDLPPSLHAAILPDDAPDAQKPLPAPVARWLEQELSISARDDAEWTSDDITLALPRPGGDGWVSIDRASGAVEMEQTDRGWIAWLNDLHKGRNTGPIWKWFIDLFAVACLIFALTGLLLLHLHSKKRRATWPLVALGLVVPAVLAVYFIH